MVSAWLFPNLRVLIRGAGDLASGIAYRLVRAGIPVMMTELPEPLFVRRTVSYGNALFAGGNFTVEGITSVLISDANAAASVLSQGQIPLLIDDSGTRWQGLVPQVVVDARMQKRNLGTTLQDAPLVIALGPGFIVGEDCHVIIETNRGHRLGRVIWEGAAIPDTGTPGTVSGYSAERVLRAPQDGYVLPAQGVEIGVCLEQGDIIATLNDIPIIAPFPGVLRGLVHPSVRVWKDLKIGDLDPRGAIENCYTISDKSLAIGGGVVEAVFSVPQIRQLMLGEVNTNAPM